ncbi:hypothetical protein WA158_007340 [Blastocystis sp. Blastoise]
MDLSAQSPVSVDGGVLEEYTLNANIYERNFFQWLLTHAFLSNCHLIMETSYETEELQDLYSKKVNRIKLVKTIESAVHVLFSGIQTFWIYLSETTTEEYIRALAKDLNSFRYHIIIVCGLDKTEDKLQSLFYSVSILSLIKVLTYEQKSFRLILCLIDEHYKIIQTAKGNSLGRFPIGNQSLMNIFYCRYHIHIKEDTKQSIYTSLQLNQNQIQYIDDIEKHINEEQIDESLNKLLYKRLSIQDLSVLQNALPMVYIAPSISVHIRNLILYISTHHCICLPPPPDTFQLALNSLLDYMIANRCVLHANTNYTKGKDPVLELIQSIHKNLPPLL